MAAASLVVNLQVISNCEASGDPNGSGTPSAAGSAARSKVRTGSQLQPPHASLVQGATATHQCRTHASAWPRRAVECMWQSWSRLGRLDCHSITSRRVGTWGSVGWKGAGIGSCRCVCVHVPTDPSTTVYLACSSCQRQWCLQHAPHSHMPICTAGFTNIGSLAAPLQAAAAAAGLAQPLIAEKVVQQRPGGQPVQPWQLAQQHGAADQRPPQRGCEAQLPALGCAHQQQRGKPV